VVCSFHTTRAHTSGLLQMGMDASGLACMHDHAHVGVVAGLLYDAAAPQAAPGDAANLDDASAYLQPASP
jgi:hypothetical protein